MDAVTIEITYVMALPIYGTSINLKYNQLDTKRQLTSELFLNILDIPDDNRGWPLRICSPQYDFYAQRWFQFAIVYCKLY